MFRVTTAACISRFKERVSILVVTVGVVTLILGALSRIRASASQIVVSPVGGITERCRLPLLRDGSRGDCLVWRGVGGGCLTIS